VKRLARGGTILIQRFLQLVRDLQSTNGRLEKEAFLSAYADDADVKAVLNFLYNPYIVSGISDKKLAKFKDSEPLPLLAAEPPAFTVLLEYFQKNNTGRDEDVLHLVTSAKLIARGTNRAEGITETEIVDLIFAVIKQDLKLGIQATTLNKVFGAGFIPQFDLMLAFPYADYTAHVEGKDFIVTEKLDGVRCVLIFDDAGKPDFFSRQGQRFENLVELVGEVICFDINYIYDGELLLANPTGLESKDLYRETVKVTNADGEKRGVVFNVFDKVLKNDFQTGTSPEPCLERKASLEKILTPAPEHVRYVAPLYIGADVSKIFELLNSVTGGGGEGVMVNIADAPYECKRSKNLLKVKMFKTADVLVEQLEEGTGRNRGKLGAVYVKFGGPDGKFYTCKVGSGFSDAERDAYWQDQSQIMGKIIEIGYFELSQNQKDTNYSLRFPTFKHVRDDKSEISMN
jgi:DNA ligase-1